MTNSRRNRLEHVARKETLKNLYRIFYNTVLCDLTLCNPIDINISEDIAASIFRVEETCSEDRGTRIFQNTDNCLPNCKATILGPHYGIMFSVPSSRHSSLIENFD
jgi:hypothetical protein